MMEIDGREPDSLKLHDWGFETEIVENMPIGDFVISNAVCIERKEINDLVSSLDNRVWEQVQNMEDNYDINILVVHGRVADLSTRNMETRKISAIYGALARLSVTYDVSVFWFREESQFIKLVKKIYKKSSDDKKRSKPHLERRNFRDDRVNVLYGIHGIGFDTATNLLDEFGSVAGVAQASKRDLQKASGVGAKTAKKIHDILHDGEEENLLS